MRQFHRQCLCVNLLLCLIKQCLNDVVTCCLVSAIKVQLIKLRE